MALKNTAIIHNLSMHKNFPKLFIEKCRKFNAALKSLAYFIDSTQIKAHINNSNKLAKLRHSTHTHTYSANSQYVFQFGLERANNLLEAIFKFDLRTHTHTHTHARLRANILRCQL